MTDFTGTSMVDSLYFIKDNEERYWTARELVFKLVPGTEDYNEVIKIVQKAWRLMHSKSESHDTFSNERRVLAESGYTGLRE